MRPLDGIRVVEVGQYIAGPYCAMLLADQGAEVVKVERPGAGDPRRGYDPLVEKDDHRTSGGFVPYNRNKKSVTIDLRAEEGAGLFRGLLATADVLVENLRPGALGEAGLGVEELREAYPRLVYCAISGYGRARGFEGPYTDRRAFDTAVQAMSGVMSVIGEAGGPPSPSVFGFADVYTAVFGATAICMALYARERTGRGAFIDQAMYDSCVSLLDRSLFLYGLTGHVPTRGLDEFAPLGALRASDGFVAVVIPTDDMWRRFCAAIERPDLLDRDDVATVLLRSKHFPDVVRPEAEAWTRQRSRAEVVARFAEHGLPAGEVQTIDEVYDCPQVDARGMLIDVEDPAMGRVRLARTPLLFPGWDPVPKGSAPQLGADTDEVLGALPGVEESDLAALRSRGVI
ncbi:MAG TPA: CoA transferase [Actinomycetota bacterium]|nr:CoA transferase [Actinomycetota bacterium]